MILIRMETLINEFKLVKLNYLTIFSSLACFLVNKKELMIINVNPIIIKIIERIFGGVDKNTIKKEITGITWIGTLVNGAKILACPYLSEICPIVIPTATMRRRMIPIIIPKITSSFIIIPSIT